MDGLKVLGLAGCRRLSDTLGATQHVDRGALADVGVAHHADRDLAAIGIGAVLGRNHRAHGRQLLDQLVDREQLSRAELGGRGRRDLLGAPWLGNRCALGDRSVLRLLCLSLVDGREEQERDAERMKVLDPCLTAMAQGSVSTIDRERTSERSINRSIAMHDRYRWVSFKRSALFMSISTRFCCM